MRKQFENLMEDLLSICVYGCREVLNLLLQNFPHIHLHIVKTEQYTVEMHHAVIIIITPLCEIIKWKT